MGVVVLVEISCRVALIADIVKQQELPVGGEPMRCVELEGWNFQGEQVALEQASDLSTSWPHRHPTAHAGAEAKKPQQVKQQSIFSAMTRSPNIHAPSAVQSLRPIPSGTCRPRLRGK